MRNWSRTVAWTPGRVEAPATLEGIVRTVDDARRAGRRLRPVGAAHSFTPLAATSGVQLSLHRHTGVVAVADGQATVRAGTRLGALGDELARRGVAQENLGDIDAQAVAGAVATGTHGTGAALGSIATQVAGLRLVTADGELLEISRRRRPELLPGAVVSLGLLGVITELTLEVVDAYRLHYRTSGRDLDDVLADLPRLVRRHRHVEFFWLPYSGRVQLKVQDVSDAPPTPRWRRDVSEVVVENVGLGLVSEIARAVPRLAPRASWLAGRLIGRDEGVAPSHRVFANRRWMRFNEMEYSLPAERLVDAIGELRDLLHRRRFPVTFPIEVRFVAADDLWLSPAHRRDSAYVAVHTYKDTAFRDYFLAAEEIFVAHGGRPHWGKVHSLTAADLRARYPRWDDFLRLREEMDPDRMFLNRYLERLLGLG